ncbi:MAG: hypothetical protein WBH40_02210 [Ignavibacteriaceae bacterium]
MVRSLLGAICIFIVVNVQAQTISVAAYADTTDYLVGDFINYEIEVVTRKNIEVISPSLPDTLSRLELIARAKPILTEDEKSKTTIYKFIFAGYDSVRAVIPPVDVKYRTVDDTSFKKIVTDSVVVQIHTVPVSTAEEIKDVKSPITIPYNWKWLLLWAAIGFLIIIAGYYSYKKYKQKKSEQPVEKKIITIPPHVKALAALENLENEQLWQKGFIKDYHSRITEIIRNYFEERFDLPAMELTTTETILHLNSIKEKDIILDITYNFLSNADLVKFAKFQPLESVNEEMMKQAKEIVQSTIPQKPVINEEEIVNV